MNTVSIQLTVQFKNFMLDHQREPHSGTNLYSQGELYI